MTPPGFPAGRDANGVRPAARAVRREGRAAPRAPAVLALGLSLLAVAGCSLPLPQATSDPTRYYLLSAPALPASPAAAAAPVIRIRPVELASYLRGRPMVVRRGPNEVQFREFARWGEPLEQGIARVLREELLARGVASSVETGMVRPSEMGNVAYDVTVRVLACEGDADGRVDFEAQWRVTGVTPGQGATTRGNFRAADLRWKPGDDASLAAALSRAVAGLAAAIAPAVAPSGAGAAG